MAVAAFGRPCNPLLLSAAGPLPSPPTRCERNSHLARSRQLPRELLLRRPSPGPGTSRRPRSAKPGGGARRLTAAAAKSRAEMGGAGAGGALLREVLDRTGRMKLDRASDREFYTFPRFVTHVDDTFLGALTQLYRERLPPGGDVLDLMSSWVSHLPPEVEFRRVVGHGLNAAELARNRRLDSFFVKDLNEDPRLELPDGSVDAVVCTVSVQYLQQPERVFAEVFRVLRPGGVCIVSFSNRMFYQKAIAAWRENSAYGRIQLVKQYLRCIAGFTEPEVVKEVPSAPAGRDSVASGPVQLLKAIGSFFQRSGQDPFYAVIAYRNFKPM